MDKSEEIKEEYCKEFGYGSFNKYNENDYSKWLEKQLLTNRVSQQRELLEAYDKFSEIEHAWFIGTEEETKKVSGSV